MRTVAPILVFVVMAVVGALAWRHWSEGGEVVSTGGAEAIYKQRTSGLHGQVQCDACHEDAYLVRVRGVDVAAVHGSDLGEQLRLTHGQRLAMVEKCAGCHRTQFMDWQGAGHSAKYKRIFLDEKQNKAEQLYADCLRCHGMFFEGGD